MAENTIDHRYTIIKKVGAGGFGCIYLVHDKKKKRTVALKTLTLPPDNPDLQKYFLSTFKTEFETLIHFQHPNLCQVFDYGFDKQRGEYYFTEEWVEGKNILEATETVDPKICEILLIETCRALEYIHSRGVVHFDIKPANILVTESEGVPHIKLIDFGLAQIKKTERTMTVGTLRYMAPELFVEGASADHRSDLYALGLVFYEVFSRHYPFVAATQSELVKAHRHEPPAPICRAKPDLAPYWEPIFARLLAKDPAERFQHANSVIRIINLNSDTEYPLETRETLSGYTYQPLIGREDILKPVKERLESFNGDFHVGILGGRGLGKSRLLHEILSFAQLHQIPALEVSGSDSFWDILKSHGIENISGHKDDFLRSGIEALIESADKGPLLLLIDNLHYLEPILIDMVMGILQTPEIGLSVITTADPASLDKEIAARLSGLEHQNKLRLFLLNPLTPEEIRLYLENVLEISAIPEEAVERFTQMTGGNPYLLQELLKGWISKGLLIDRKTRKLRWKEIPKTEGLEALIRETVKQVRGDAKTILDALVVHGRRLEEQTLRQATGLSPEAFQKSAGDLLKQQLIVKREDHFECANALLREITYTLLSSWRREKIHARLLELLEKKNVPLGHLAYHTYHAGAATQSAILLKAADEAEAHFEYAESLDWIEKWLDLERKKEKAPMELRAAKLESMLGLYPQAKTRLQEALKKVSKPVLLRAQILRALGWICQKEGSHARALACFEECEKIAGSLKDDFQIVALNDLGHYYLAHRKWPEAIEQFEKSAGLLETHPNLEYAQNNQLALAYLRVGKTAEAAAFTEKKLRWAEAQGNLLAKGLTLSERGQMDLETGELPRAKAHYQEALKILRSLHPSHCIKILSDLLSIAQTESWYGDALQYLEELLERSGPTASASTMAHYYLTAGNLYIAIGLFTKAHQYLKQSQQLYDSLGDDSMQGWVCIAHGYLQNGLAQWGPAAKWFANAVAAGQKRKEGVLSAYALFGLCDAHFWEGKKEEAEKDLQTAIREMQSLQDPELEHRRRLMAGLLDPTLPIETELLLQEKNPERSLENREWLTRSALHQQDIMGAARWYSEGMALIRQMVENLPEAYQESFRLQWRIQRFIQLLAQPGEASEVTLASIEESASTTKEVTRK